MTLIPATIIEALRIIEKLRVIEVPGIDQVRWKGTDGEDHVRSKDIGRRIGAADQEIDRRIDAAAVTAQDIEETAENEIIDDQGIDAEVKFVEKHILQQPKCWQWSH